MPESKNISSKNEVTPTKWHHKSFRQLFEELQEFFHDLVDLRDGMDERGSIISILNNKEMKGANAVLLMCSIMVASLGLDLNSPAVIIGAMLISPLMSPILGIGLGVGINDRETLFISLQHFFLSVVIALVTSYIYFGFLTPFGELTNEIRGRTEPNLLDGMVAIFGGVAGVISITRLDKSNAIPGVAIATALMPPVCVAGFGLATGRWDFFLNAFYLFFLNSFFIALSTYLIIRLLGFKYKQYPSQKEQRRNKIFMLVFSAIILAPAIYFIWDAYQDLQEKQKIEVFINKHFENEFTAISDWDINENEGTIQLDIQLIGNPVSSAKIDSCDAELDRLLGKQVKVTTYQSKEIPFDEIKRLRQEMGGFQEGLANQISNLEQIQQEKTIEIEQLNLALDSVKNVQSKIVFADIFKNAKTIYPAIDEIGLAKEVQRTDFPEQTKFPVLMVKWKPTKSKKTRVRDQERLKKIIRNQAQLDTLLVIAY